MKKFTDGAVAGYRYNKGVGNRHLSEVPVPVPVGLYRRYKCGLPVTKVPVTGTVTGAVVGDCYRGAVASAGAG